MAVLGTIDIGGDGQEILLANLNHVLGEEFTLDDFEFSEPELVATPTPTHNTVVKFGPKAHSGYYGVKRIYYNRVHVSELGPIAVPRGIATRVSHLLPVINSKYGILIKVEDIYDADLPDPEPGENDIEVLLDFRPTSLVFYGGAMIVAGTNDPSIGDGDGFTLPFEPFWMFFAENIHDEVLDAYSVSIDRDKTRRRTANTIDDESADRLGLVYQRSILTTEFDGGYFGHIVGAWSGSNQTQAYALNIYGHVLQRTPNGREWSTIVDIGGVNMLNMAEVNEAQTNKKYHCVAQDVTGSVYLLSTKEDEVVLEVSSDYGLTWSDIELEGVFPLLDHVVWEADIISILDAVATATDMYLIVHQHEQGNGKLSLYEINYSTGNVQEHNLAMVAIRNTATFIKPSDKKGAVRGCFVSTGQAAFTHPRFAVLTNTGSAANMQPLMYVWDDTGAQYRPEATGRADFYPDQANYPGSFISAYSVDMTKDGGFSLDVIEMGTMLEAEEPDFELFKKNPSTVRTEDNFYNHGLIVMTRVKVANSYAPWHTQELALSSGSYPQRLIFNDINRRTHYVIQPESGLYRLSFVDNESDRRVDAVVDDSTTIGLPMHSGYRNHTDYGLGRFDRPTILESSNTNYNAGAYSDAEKDKSPILYSFSGIDEEGKYRWLVSQSTSNPLAPRDFAREYNFMGGAPVAMFNDEDEHYVLTSGNRGVYHWDTVELKWNFIGSLQAVVFDDIDDSLIGWNSLELNPSNIVGFNKKANGIIQLHVKVNKSINVTEYDDAQLKKALTITDEGIISIRADNLVGYDANQPFLYRKINNVESFGFNAMSDVSPREFKAIAFTTVGGEHHNALYSDSSELDAVDTNISLPVGFPTDVEVLDYRSEVEFMELQGIYYLKQEGEEKYWLAFHHDDGTMTTQDLFGGGDPVFANFKPTHVFFLYEYMDANYVPIIYYGSNRVLLINSFVEDGTFAITSHNLSIPGNNGSGLRVLPVLSSNRSEKLFAQKGNGVFKLRYNKNMTTRTVTFTLEKIFDLSLQYSDVDIYSACVTNKDNVVQPDESYIPPWPENGTLLSTFCDDVTKMGVYADGDGGTYVDIEEQNSLDCGYVPPDPANLDPNAVTITASLTSTDSTLVTPTAIATEGSGEAYATFVLDGALQDEAHLDVTLEYLTADAADIDTIEYQIDDGARVPVVLNDVTAFDLTLPPTTESFKFYFTFIADETMEGDEEFKLILSIPEEETHIANGADIKAVFRILDTSQPMPPPPVEAQRYLDDFVNDNKSFGAVVPGNVLTEFYSEYNGTAGSTAVQYQAGKLVSTNLNPATAKFAEYFAPTDIVNEGFKDLKFTFDFSITKSIVKDDESAPANLDYSSGLPQDYAWNATELGFFLVNSKKSDAAGERALYVAIKTDPSSGGVSFSIDAVDGTEGDLSTTPIESVVASTQTVFNSLRRGTIKLEALFFGADTDRRLAVIVNDTALFTKKIPAAVCPLDDEFIPVIYLGGANINEANIRSFRVAEMLPEPEDTELYFDDFVNDNKSFNDQLTDITSFYKEINNKSSGLTEVLFDTDKLTTTNNDPAVVKLGEYLTVKNYVPLARPNISFSFNAYVPMIVVDDYIDDPAVAKAVNWNAELGPSDQMRDSFIHVFFMNTGAAAPEDPQALHLKFGSFANNNAILYEVNEVPGVPGSIEATAISNVIPLTLSSVAMPKGGEQKFDVHLYRDDALHRRMRLILNGALVFDRVFDSSLFPLEDNYIPVLSLKDANWNEVQVRTWRLGDMVDFAPALQSWPAPGLPYVVDFIGDNGNYGLIQPGNTIVEFFDDLADINDTSGNVSVEFTQTGLRVERALPVEDTLKELLTAKDHETRKEKNISLVLDVDVENIEVYNDEDGIEEEILYAAVLDVDQAYQEEELILYLLNPEDDDSNGKRSVSVSIKTDAGRTESTIQARYIYWNADTREITNSLVIESPQTLGSLVPLGGAIKFELYTEVDGGNRKGKVKINGSQVHEFLIESMYAGATEEFLGAVSMTSTRWSRFQIKRFEVTEVQ